jgi:hypothetical protein
LLNINYLSIILKTESWSPNLREQVIEHQGIALGLNNFSIDVLVKTRQEIPYKALTVAKKMESCLHVSIIGSAKQY